MHRHSSCSKKTIKDVISAQKNVAAAWVFGSEARGRQKKSSDVDIALLLEDVPSGSERVALRSGLASALSPLFGREVDIVILNTAGSLLKYQVARDGKILFERHKGGAKRFRLNALHEYFYYLPTFNFHFERQARGPS